jgi:hypothetical protein
MLRDDVVEAVGEGQFHIYAVSTIAEGIELLTGMPAGEPDAEGNYPEGTLYARVQQKLEQYAQYMQEDGKDDEEEEEPFPPEGPEEEEASAPLDEDGDIPEEPEDETE